MCPLGVELYRQQLNDDPAAEPPEQCSLGVLGCLSQVEANTMRSASVQVRSCSVRPWRSTFLFQSSATYPDSQ
jgi:hypothetical protein